MNLLQRLFGVGKAEVPQPDILFGRYSDAYKNGVQLAAWNEAMASFDAGRPMQAYRQFFTYLRDEREDNLHWRETGKAIFFEFQQGSRLITGKADAQKVQASSKIAKVNDLNVGFLRRLMEQNYALKFCRYALSPDNYLVIAFDTSALDGTPLKLVQALRELALHADKQDDLLLDEFGSLQAAEGPPEIPIPDHEKAIKYAYIRREIESAFAEIDRGQPDPAQVPGGYAYLLLGLAYRLDYIVRPEGYMMDMMERLHHIYFMQQEQSAQNKLHAIRKELQNLLDRPEEAVCKEMYRTRSTFGMNPPIGHDRLVNLIYSELPNMDWYANQHYEALALAVPRYIAGYALFHFAPSPPVRDLLHLFFQIIEQDIFVELGFQLRYVHDDDALNRRIILREVQGIRDRHVADFPDLAKMDTQMLDFGSRARFARSYLVLIKSLNL
jgi:hypothetical protein